MKEFEDRRVLENIVKVARGIEIADLVIRNAKIVNVFAGNIIEGDVAIVGDRIAGISKDGYEGKEIIDANGRFLCPGFMDGHIHIESSHLTCEELGRAIIPYGTTTIVADPHEIANVCGIEGIRYMIRAAEKSPLDIRFMLPSCVPATEFEDAGAIIDSVEMKKIINDPNILGIGEFMDFNAILNCDKNAMEKIVLAHKYNKVIDGHSPNLIGKDLDAYISTGVTTDHECSTIEEMEARINRGMYVLLRLGSACKELKHLVKGVNSNNSRRCLLCSDDRQPKTILEEGHMNSHLKLCVENGIDPITAIQMTTINVAECYGLKGYGAVAPSYKANLCLINDLKDFNASFVLINGKTVAQNGKYIPKLIKESSDSCNKTMHLNKLTIENIDREFKSNKIWAIELIKDSVLTKKSDEYINLDKNNRFIRSDDKDIVKIVVAERHNYTKKIGTGFLKGYGLTKGGIAMSIGHDSHNVISVGATDIDIICSINNLIDQEGGIVLTLDGNVIASMPMPIAGLMSDKDCNYVNEGLKKIHEMAHNTLGVNNTVDPIMTLCFMSLPVIPELKITDRGIFDVAAFNFIDLEIKGE